MRLLKTFYFALMLGFSVAAFALPAPSVEQLTETEYELVVDGMIVADPIDGSRPWRFASAIAAGAALERYARENPHASSYQVRRVGPIWAVTFSQ